MTDSCTYHFYLNLFRFLVNYFLLDTSTARQTEKEVWHFRPFSRFFFFGFAPKWWQTKMIFLASTMAHPQLVDWDEGIWMNRDIDCKGSWILTWKTTHTHTQKEESIVLTKKKDRCAAALIFPTVRVLFLLFTVKETRGRSTTEGKVKEHEEGVRLQM